MINLVRKYQQPALIIVTVVTLGGFLVLWNNQQVGRGLFTGGADKFGSVYGETITKADLDRVEKKYRLAAELQMGELMQPLAGNAQNASEAYQNFVLNSFVFEHEADALQIFPTQEEVQQEEAKIQGFQTDGQFDPEKLRLAQAQLLPPLGFSEDVIDELAREQVRVKKVIALLGSAIQLTPSELANRYTEENEKMDLSVIRLNASERRKKRGRLRCRCQESLRCPSRRLPQRRAAQGQRGEL